MLTGVVTVGRYTGLTNIGTAQDTGFVGVEIEWVQLIS